MEESKFYNRRNFIKKVSVASMAIPLLSSFSFIKKTKYRKITILHTNDMHSHIDPFPINDSKFPGLGGMTRIASLIENIKSKESNVILLDAGDIFQGTPYFNKYKGKLELQLMSKMGYEASTMGNHDFDNGIDGFSKVMHHAEFPFICSNYDFSNTVLENKTNKYKIITIDNIKIGILGIGIKLDGLVNENLYKGVKYLDPIKTANHYAELLKNEKNCNIVICLSHLGHEYDNNSISDIKLAQVTNNINVIIGGHTHTFLQEAKKVKNLDNKDVLVNQAGWGALSLGRLDLFFDKKNNEMTNLASDYFNKKNYAKI
jgi:5'-nucleotidase